MRVADLIVPAGRAKWHSERLQIMFTSKDTKLVLGIPLSKRLHEDRLIWELNKSGVFSIKATYYLGTSLN